MMKRASLVLLGCALCLGLGEAAAAGLRVQVVDQTGAPVTEAVVYATPLSGKMAHGKPAGAIIDQIQGRFVPFVSVVQTGTAISFPNKDNVEHDVYSFSPAKNFDLPLYHGVPANPVVFDKAGLVVMGCNVHDKMIAYLLVVDTPYFAKTDTTGFASIDRVPAESYKLTVWHHRMTDANAMPTQKVAAGADATTIFSLQLKAQ
ncbi:methylamine utilization protein [Cupriavidus sp. RAF12]|uniref:methylamine utilization protein n=1 Tax=Cupriavidus sp. RAF12 TaxID=3233050 RepID=UPI003F8F3DB2